MDFFSASEKKMLMFDSISVLKLMWKFKLKLTAKDQNTKFIYFPKSFRFAPLKTITFNLQSNQK